jgi:hypothetical protein
MKNPKLVKNLSLSALALGLLAAAAPTPPAPAPATAPAPDSAPKITSSSDLGGTDRFLSYVSTDKPIYRANEKVWVRSVLLNAATHQPLSDAQVAQADVQILGPHGEVVASGAAQSQDSVVAFGWTVPEGAAGGEYTFKIKYPVQGYAPSERKFDVRTYRAPRLKNQITFARDGYGTGDKVTATVHSERAEGGFPAGAKVTIIARVDDNQVFTAPTTIDAKGDAVATFNLPKAMERGDGTLAFAIQDGGTVETASKTIPILLQTLDLNIYPEGGDAVAGVDNRYYLEAKTPNQKPADLVGAIFDSKGKKMADVKTEHEGRARFEFTPAKGETYTLKLIEPAGITKTWNLPAAKETGVVIHTVDNIVQKEQPVKLWLESSDLFGKYTVTLKRREADVANPVDVIFPKGIAGRGKLPQEIGDPGPLSSNITFTPNDDADGVLTLTVWNNKGEPLAERLIYRQPAHQVNIALKPNQSTYTPGSKATLDITTTDEAGKPISAVVGLTVTDDSVQEMLEKRDRAPRLPVMVFLEPEVKDLADAQVYLDPNNPKAALDTDLLLGTQGWRRFAVLKPTEFITRYGDDAKRVLAFVQPEPQRPEGLGGGGIRRMAMPMAVAGIPAPGQPQNFDMQLADDAFELGVNEDAVQKKAVEKLPADANIPPAGGPAANKKIAAGADQAAAQPMAPLAQMRMMRPMNGGGGPGALVIVREFAHELRPNWSPADRSDFTETVYWNAGIKTDESGKGSASFALADSVTSLRVFADAFQKSGAIGSSSSAIQSVQPFFIEPKIPLEVTAGDVIDLPVSAVNNTADAFKDFALTLTAGAGLSIAPQKDTPSANLAPGARTRQTFHVSVGDTTGDIDLTLAASAGAFTDKVTRKLHVRPKGFPTQIAFGGLVDNASPAKKSITIPNSLVPASLTTFATVYPSPMANLTDAVACLLQEPNGCFEQTSSTNYPLAMAQTYLTTHQGVDPKLAAKGAELLAHGYQKLIAFECTNKGYEWFGGSTPGHEALTAYGLMEFHDMQNAGLATVDDKMIDRTKTWLINREDGKGGFQRNPKSLDSFGGAPELTTNAYIVWALQQAGQTGLEKEISTVREAAKTSTDTYVLALAADICLDAKDPESAKFFMNQLVKHQNKTGGIDGATTSITRSGGQALSIETTALATLAFMHEKEFAAAAQAGIQFLAENCKGGRFGSTQPRTQGHRRL